MSVKVSLEPRLFAGGAKLMKMPPINLCASLAA